MNLYPSTSNRLTYTLVTVIVDSLLVNPLAWIYDLGAKYYYDGKLACHRRFVVPIDCELVLSTMASDDYNIH